MSTSSHLRTLVLLLLCHMAMPLAQAQTPNLHWARMARTAAGDTYGYDIAIDPAGYVYVVGSFMGTVDLNPTAGTFNVTSAGGIDAYVQKLDTNGNFIAAYTFPGAGDGEARKVTLDASGNVYISGHFNGTADYNPSAATANLTAAGIADMFIVKLSSAGTYLWANRVGTAPFEYVIPMDMEVDASGFLHTVGYFTGTVDFNPGASTLNLASAGFYDAFVQKLDGATGTFTWARRWGGTHAEYASVLSFESGGNLLINGINCSTSADFDPGAGVFTMGAFGTGSQNTYVTRLTPAGAFVNATQFGGPGAVTYGGSALDPAGNIILAGMFNDTIDIDPGVGVTTYFKTATTEYDMYVVKLNASYALQWSHHFSSSDDLFAYGMSTDLYGNIYISGDFQGTVDFDPGPGVANRSAGGYNSFVLKLDPAGNLVWISCTENNAEAFSYDMALDQRLNVYVTGDFNGNEDFDPQATTFTMSAPGTPYAQHVYKLRQVNPFVLPASAALKATATDGAIHLTWQLSGHDPAATLTLLRSQDGSHYAPLAALTSASSSYTDTDAAAGITYLYQLQITDVDGRSTLSNRVEAQLPQEDGFALWPNPAQGSVTLSASQPLGQILITDMMGRQVMQADAGETMRHTLDLTGLPPGTYGVRCLSLGADMAQQLVVR